MSSERGVLFSGSKTPLSRFSLVIHRTGPVKKGKGRYPCPVDPETSHARNRTAVKWVRE